MTEIKWALFKLSDLFDIKKGKRLTKADMVGGKTPFIAAIDHNNGVRQYIDRIPIHLGNTITVNYNGSVGEAFYQKDPFFASDDVNVLYPKFEMDQYIAMFIITVIKKEQYRFNYGRKWKLDRMCESTISLPFSTEGHPDFEYMRNYIQNIWPEKISEEPILDTIPALDTSTWVDFNYTDIFVIKKGYYNKKPEHTISGNIPFLGATDSNNGYTEVYSMEDICMYNRDGSTKPDDSNKKLFAGNCIAVTNNGSVGHAFYQKDMFTCSHDVNPLYLKNHELNVYIAMFLITVIERDRYRWNYGRKWRPVRMNRSTIKLPVNSKGTPDYEYMESYIKSLPFSSAL